MVAFPNLPSIKVENHEENIYIKQVIDRNPYYITIVIRSVINLFSIHIYLSD